MRLVLLISRNKHAALDIKRRMEEMKGIEEVHVAVGSDFVPTLWYSADLVITHREGFAWTVAKDRVGDLFGKTLHLSPWWR